MAAARAAGEVVVVAGADHGFDVGTSVPRSLAAVGEAVEAVVAFLDAGHHGRG